MANFHEWWVSEIGHPPADEEDRKLFAFALRAWRSALAFGQIDMVRPVVVERALKRVGEGESTAEDELTLRERILIGDETIAALQADLNEWDGRPPQVEPEAAVAVQAEPEGPIPPGATPLGGIRWRCPRCNFMGGMRQVETVCRGCSYPGDDTRAWKVDPEDPAHPDYDPSKEDGGDAG
jgi:hypothetical protein